MADQSSEDDHGAAVGSSKLHHALARRVRLGGVFLDRGRLWAATRAARLRAPGTARLDAGGNECCVGFFGLNRSLRKTAPSIALNIYEPLKRAELRVTAIAHFNRPDRIHSPRSGEHAVVATNAGADQLGCELIWSEAQDQENIRGLLDLVLGYPMRGEEDSSGIIRRNALLQMYSQSRLLKLIRMADIDRFKLFCLARSDLLYLDSVPEGVVSSILSGKVDIVTPGWHRWHGFNDRFAFCSRRGAEIYLDRMSWVARFCETKGYFHPEEILRFSVEQSGIGFDFMPMRAMRVRSTGAVKNEDFSLIE